MAFNNPTNSYLYYQVRYADQSIVTGSAPLYSRGVDMGYLWGEIDLETGLDSEGEPVSGVHMSNGRVDYVEFEFRLGTTGPWTKYRIPVNDIGLYF